MFAAVQLPFAVGCNSRICPHPVGPIILRSLGIGGIIAIVIVVLLVVFFLLVRGGWGEQDRHRMG